MLDSTDSVNLVAFVFSPLQALNLIEYSRRFTRPVDLVVVGAASEIEPASRIQIEAVLSMEPPRQVIYCEWPRSWGRKPIRVHKEIRSGVTEVLAHLQPRPYEFVVGEYRSAFSWAVLHRLKDLVRSVTVLDDGTATLRIDRRRSLWRSSKRWREKLKSLILLGLGIRGIFPPDSLTFFTTYSLDTRLTDDDVVLRNDYRALRAELQDLPPDKDSVYVIGSPYQEKGVVDDGDVEMALELARFAAESTGRDVVYMAHRSERAEKLDALREKVTVVLPDVPFEIYAQAVGKRPQRIVGYTSSLFVTAAELLGESVDIVALEIPRDRVNDSWLSFVDDIYRYYRDELGSAIRVVKLPTT